MSSTDFVTEAVESLEAKVKEVSAVRNRTLYVYSQAQLLDYEAKVNTPCTGVVYVRTNKLDSGNRREQAWAVYCNVVVLGGQACTTNITQQKQTTTQILAEIRDKILLNKADDDLNWIFEREEPIRVAAGGNPKLFGYFQQWSVIYTYDAVNGWHTGG